MPNRTIEFIVEILYRNASEAKMILRPLTLYTHVIHALFHNGSEGKTLGVSLIPLLLAKPMTSPGCSSIGFKSMGILGNDETT